QYLYRFILPRKRQMKKIARALFAAICALLLAGLSVQAQDSKFDGTIRIGGSTTLLPVIADCVSQFMEKFETWDKVDASLPKERILIFVTGGGSGSSGSTRPLLLYRCALKMVLKRMGQSGISEMRDCPGIG